MSFNSGINNPLPVESNPISLIDILEDGKEREKAKKAAITNGAYPHASVVKSPIPTLVKEDEPVEENSAEEGPKRDWPRLYGYVSGISLELSTALQRAGMYHYERALKLLTHMGYAQQGLWRGEFISILSGSGAGWIPKKSASNAFDEGMGRFRSVYKSSYSYKEAVVRGRKRFSEFVPKIVPKDTLIQMERTKSGTNSRGSKRGQGRPQTEWVYIPSEDELWELLIVSGLANRLDHRLSTTPCYEKYDDITQMPKHKAVILGTFVMVHGAGLYSREKLSKLTNISKGSARPYCERVGITVTKQDPKRDVLKEESFKYLPADEREIDRRISMKLIPQGIHLEVRVKEIMPNGHIYGKWVRFPLTRGAAYGAQKYSRENGGDGIVFKARYSASKYNPSTSDYAKLYILTAEAQAERSVDSSWDKFTDVAHHSPEIQARVGG